jgi:CTP:molybdopterin cytidylyltransferase MocA
MTINEKWVMAVVLAAGGASRFGTTKQLARINDKTLVQHSIELAREVCGSYTILVTGHDSAAVAAAGISAQFLIVNDRYTDGIGSSISAAVRSISHAADAIVILLADQPLITADHLRAIRDAWSGADDEIVATSFADTEGPPVLLPRATFESLTLLSGDKGARSILHDPGYKLKTVEFQNAAVDIDTPEQLRQLLD